MRKNNLFLYKDCEKNVKAVICLMKPEILSIQFYAKNLNKLATINYLQV